MNVIPIEINTAASILLQFISRLEAVLTRQITGVFIKEETMTKNKLLCAILLVLSGCLTMSGTYNVTAFDKDGKPLLGNVNLMALGSGIYNMRNAICVAYPKATVIIRDRTTGEELKSESPYQC